MLLDTEELGGSTMSTSDEGELCFCQSIAVAHFASLAVTSQCGDLDVGVQG